MSHHHVVIIGAGPSGLFAAAELARHGVRARLVERDVVPHRQARATAIQPGTLEILESAGLLRPFLDTAEHVLCSRLYGPGMVELGGLSHDGLDCRHAFQCSLPQYETQRILEEHLTSLGGRVERGVTATQIEPAPDGVTVELLHADGRTESARAAYLIGAGGAHSVTRHSMTEPLEGATYRGHFLAADIAMDGPFPRGEAGVICGPLGLLLLAPLPGGRWISFQDLEEDVESVTADEVAERVAARLGGRHRPTDVAWLAPFRMHRRIVSRLTDGRRFLIGDAAHLSSPFGGEGLNAGLHDAHDLAWKLALVLRGDSPSALVAHYAVERAIADRHVLEVSDEGAHLDRRRARRGPCRTCGRAGRRRSGDDRAGAQRALDDRRRLRRQPAGRGPRQRSRAHRRPASRPALPGLDALRRNVAPCAGVSGRSQRIPRSAGSNDAGRSWRRSRAIRPPTRPAPASRTAVSSCCAPTATSVSARRRPAPTRSRRSTVTFLRT